MGGRAYDAKRKRDGDDEDDVGNMFDSSDSAVAALNSARSATRALKALNTGLRQQAKDAGQKLGRTAWDDPDGYYIATVHETLADRYIVTDRQCGRGVFSSVVKAKDSNIAAEGTGMVAIKIVRSSAAFEKSAEKEVEILEKLQSIDGPGRRYIVEMQSTFRYRGHFCIAFECLWDDCREALRVLTKGKGISLLVVRAYAQQLLLGLRHLEKCSIFHADIKPDNILMSKDHQVVKYCDFGTAVEMDEAEASAYVMSRAYRAPEIIIGQRPSTAADTFALACTFYELFTGKALASGKSNHDQLRKVMDLKGMLPAHVIKSGEFWKAHFTKELVFKPDLSADRRHAAADEVDNPLKLKIQQLKAQMETFPKQSIKELVFERIGPERCSSEARDDQNYVLRGQQFAQLLEDMLALDPQQRLGPKLALSHAFFS